MKIGIPDQHSRTIGNESRTAATVGNKSPNRRFITGRRAIMRRRNRQDRSMTNVASSPNTPTSGRPGSASSRANALAERLEQGARALAEFAGGLTEAQWQTRVPGDGRTIGIVVDHVASVYPIEIQLAQRLAAGQPVTGVTMDDVHAMNAAHARENQAVTKEAAVEHLRRSSAVAAAAIRALSDTELDRAAEASLYSNAPITCQFMLEDHAVRHSYHHLARIRKTLDTY